MFAPRAPALGLCAVFLAAVALARASSFLPVGAGAVLLLLGAALGGRSGRATVAAAAGLLVAALAPRGAPPFQDTARPTEVVGRVCSHEVRFGPRVSVELCAERMRQGIEIAQGRWPLRLDLPDGAAAPPLGARLRAIGMIGRTPGYENRYRSPAGRLALRIKSGHFLEVEAPPARPLAWAARLRAAFERGWRRLGAERPGVALARTMALGDTAAAPARWARALRRTGLAHLTAVSGFNVALVAGWAAIAGALLPRPLRIALAAAAALGYLGLVGPAPSMLRAAAMALVAALALLSRRAPLALQGLALVSTGMVALDPSALDDVGLRLSVAATAGLLIGAGGRGAERWTWRQAAARGLAASLAAQAAAAPVSVAAFGQVSALAPLLNLVFAPWAALVLVLGLLAGALAAAGAAPLAAPALWCLDRATLALEGLARWPPSPWISAPATHSWMCGALVGIGFALPAAGRRGRRAALLLALVLAAAAPADRRGGAEIEIAVLDVGQGDAILLRAGDRVALVDGGGARGRNLATQVLLPALAARGIDRLDLVVLSHFDYDHCAGLIDLASYIRIEELWLPRGAPPSACSRELVAELAAPVRAVAAGERRRLGSLGLEVLHPEPGSAPQPGNAASLVLRVEAAGHSALLLADLGSEGERRLVRRWGAGLRCDLLKVAHHGSASSSSAELLALARPRLAVVSAGARNAYGHPSPRALARLAGNGARLLRTDRDGGVEVRWRAGEPWAIGLPGSPRRSTLGDG